MSFEWGKLDIEYGETIELAATIETYEAIPNASVRIPFYDLQGLVVAEWNSKRAGRRIDLSQGTNTLRIRLGPLCLRRGTYKPAFVLNDSGGIRLPVWSYKKHSVHVNGAPGGASVYQLPAH